MRRFEYFGLLISCLAIMLGMLSCHKDSITEDYIPDDSPRVEKVESYFFGRVSNAQQEPISADIELNEEITECSLSGIFDFGKVTMNREGQIVKIGNETSTPYYCWMFAELGRTSFIDVELKNQKITEQADLNEDVTIGDFDISYEAETLISNGEIYKGNRVKFELHDALAPNLEDRVHLPMPDFTISEEETKKLEMIELFYLKIRGDQNDQLDIAQNHGIILSREISSYSSNLDGYQLYYWDELLNQWRPADANFVYQNGKVEYWLKNTGWWCVAKEVPAIQQKFEVFLENEPLAFQKILISCGRSKQEKVLHTNDKGEAYVILASNETYEYNIVDYCNELVLVENFNASETEAELISFYERENHLKTSILDCDNQAVMDELFLLNNRDRYWPLKPNSNGNIMMLLSECHDGEFIHLENAHRDKNYFLSKSLLEAGNQDSTWVCDDFEIGGHIIRGQQTMTIDSTLRAFIDTSNLRIYLYFHFFGNIEEFIITDISSNSIQGYAQGRMFNSDKEDHSIRFNIHQISGEGGLFIADFEGEVSILGSSQTDDISGSLVARIEGFK